MDIQMKNLSKTEYKVMSTIAGCVMVLQHMNAIERTEKNPANLQEMAASRPKVIQMLRLNLSKLSKINPAKAKELTAGLYKEKLLKQESKTRSRKLKKSKRIS